MSTVTVKSIISTIVENIPVVGSGITDLVELYTDINEIRKRHLPIPSMKRSKTADIEDLSPKAQSTNKMPSSDKMIGHVSTIVSVASLVLFGIVNVSFLVAVIVTSASILSLIGRTYTYFATGNSGCKTYVTYPTFFFLYLPVIGDTIGYTILVLCFMKNLEFTQNQKKSFFINMGVNYLTKISCVDLLAVYGIVSTPVALATIALCGVSLIGRVYSIASTPTQRKSPQAL